MAFIKRLGWYLVGLSIGIVFLTFFLKKKSDETGTEFCYFPNCRVLKDLRSKPLSYSNDIKTLLNNKTIDSTTVAYFLNDGDIDFGNSDTKSTPCKTYKIEGLIKEKEAVLTVINCTDKVVIDKIDLSK
ncbi:MULTISPECIES: hypothetical protein [Cellulophaga]|uniref:DUF4258 domain-containing protein n=2 Tax=Cellulophaga TaxID=104264 RepID=F0RCQ9_CELLC|nr:MULTISPECIES: hypothetical protein [Cellulophaga]ADY30791.1 hypothetical protein Celly_2974 [Cellulophaga lytica DSM 7489]AIM61771.1 hypothetical protein IX49_14990 [Cellulophaga lytica]APU11688.1 hypothetical protein A5M85_15800 [Cellulophaga lytica]EWH14625.1 hypothetical protein KLA_02317 [Cellulophaga geojensis KL-A]MDO6852677.1 DUF4258 domain-containing protein [Cellulophaga lytica]